MEIMKYMFILISVLLINACDFQENTNCDVESFIWNDGVSYYYVSNINTDTMQISAKKIGRNEWIITESFVIKQFGETVQSTDTYKLIKEGCKLVEHRGSKSYPYFIIPTNSEKKTWKQYGDIYEGNSVKEIESKCLVSDVVIDSYSALNSFNVTCEYSANGSEDLISRQYLSGKGLTRFTQKVTDSGHTTTLWDLSLKSESKSQ